MMIEFKTTSGGRPEGHDLISWFSSDVRPGYPTNNGRQYRWTGRVEAVEIDCEPERQWDGSLFYRKFRLQEGTEFYYGGHGGNARRFDRACIRLAE